jgi:hypothetical protein
LRADYAQKVGDTVSVFFTKPINIDYLVATLQKVITISRSNK